MTTRLTPKQLTALVGFCRRNEAAGGDLGHEDKALLDLADRIEDLELAAQPAPGALISGTREFRMSVAADLDNVLHRNCGSLRREPLP